MQELEISNKPLQYVLLFLLVSLTSGSLFCWIVLENHFAQHDMPGKKYNGYGFMTCLLTFVITGTVLHMKLLSLILQKMKFMTSIYMGVALFILGLILIVVGALYVPELLFAAEILISYAGSQIYVSMFCLFPCFKHHAVSMSCAFATSTMLLQVVDVPVPFYVPFVVWIVLLLLVTVFFKPNQPEKIFTHSSKLEKMKEVFKYTELYPVYLNVLFGMAAKSYYQNGYFARLAHLGIDPTNMQYIYTVSNFSSILAGFFNFLKLEQSHVINVVLSVVFNLLILTYECEFTISLNLFLMNISSTGVITSALSLCPTESNLFESNSIVYISMFLGDIIGMASMLKINMKTMDLVIVSTSMIMQIFSASTFTIIFKKKLFKSKYVKLSELKGVRDELGDFM
ncbi:Conserved_hypothetical protein [Hexamita inflata]|uniref:Uncharacterized protein n=1 Tax=Hexamita inflata TaxID=28002 RepID=A0AA86R468_9EUKA|nr:Conserved hypothetical protein [Hexamita inflata]